MNKVSQLSSLVGRFAPSPTGPLHFGSLVAAVGSYLETRSRGGRWLLRVEDVDRPRAITGMADQQLAMLDAYGFIREGAVLRQSERASVYQAALAQLIAADLAYPCTCTRSQIAAHPAVQLGVDGAMVYPGTCANWRKEDAVPEHAAWRFRVPTGPAAEIAFSDRVQGVCRQNLGRDVGDFVLLRADGCFTYQLAVVVDDLAQGVSEIVRGADLLDSTARQIALIRALGGVPPVYAHLPVVANVAGEKLSKQTLAQALPDINEAARVAMLWAALTFLGQSPARRLRESGQEILWAWALEAWSLERVPRCHSLPLPEGLF